MTYKISYYSIAVQQDIRKLPETLIARYFALTDRMVTHGANLGAPHTQPMGDGLFELRLKGTDGIARVFYCTLVGKRIVMLHCFVKKTQKTPKRELVLALQRLREVKRHG